MSLDLGIAYEYTFAWRLIRSTDVNGRVCFFFFSFFSSSFFPLFFSFFFLWGEGGTNNDTNNFHLSLSESYRETFCAHSVK